MGWWSIQTTEHRPGLDIYDLSDGTKVEVIGDGPADQLYEYMDKVMSALGSRERMRAFADEERLLSVASAILPAVAGGEESPPIDYFDPLGFRECLELITGDYQSAWGRKPTVEEIRSLIRFCATSL